MHHQNRTPFMPYNYSPGDVYPPRMSTTSPDQFITYPYPNMNSSYGSPSFSPHSFNPAVRSTPPCPPRFFKSPNIPPPPFNTPPPPIPFSPLPHQNSFNHSSGYTPNSSVYHTPSPFSARSKRYATQSFNTTATPSFESAREMHFSSTIDTSANARERSYSSFHSGHGKSSFPGWIGRALADPWIEIEPKRTPKSGTCLVSRPLAQRHTVLFAPRQRRRKAEDDDEEVSAELDLESKRLSLAPTNDYEGVINVDALPCFNDSEQQTAAT